jgi:hypothetical protein
MKKAMLFLGITLMLSVLSSSELSLSKTTDSHNVTLITSVSIPDDLNVVFKNSCMACHSTGGKMMAMSKLNFSDWNNYTPDKQANKATAICKVITKGAMPPQSFLDKNPQAVLTASQKDMICKWSKSLNPEK